MGAGQKALQRDSGLDWPSTGSPVKFRIDLQPVTLEDLMGYEFLGVFRTVERNGGNYVGCNKAKRLDQTGGDGDPQRGCLQG